MNLRSEVYTSDEIAELNTVLPDIKVEGHLNVVTEGNLRSRGANQSEVQSVASSTPKTNTSKFRSQIFSRYQQNTMEKSPSAVLRQMIPSKPMDALNMKFASVLNLQGGRKSPRSEEDS